jgi:hypothetical protein
VNITEKLNLFEKEGTRVLCESGIRNVRNWAKHFKKAICYFHVDLDGVTSALGMKNYLYQYGIKTIDAIPIQYGSLEFAVKTPPPGVLVYCVDFAHVKPIFHIITDHHDSEHLGATKDMSVSFVKAPSNATHISMIISPRDIFPQEDLKIISTVDSADFASQGLKPDDIMRAAFNVNPELNVEKNHRAMGLVTNKLLLAYKNKPNFLSDLVMTAKPSLISMYNNIKKLAKKNGYSPPEEVERNQAAYNETQKGKIIKGGTINDIKNLKNGDSMFINGIVVQYGGGAMGKGKQYDRYTVFKNHPDAQFLCIGWPPGLIQVSKNPFKKGELSIHLGELVMGKVMKKYESKLRNQMVSLGTLKRMYESDIEKKGLEGAVGFTFDDLINTFKPTQVQGIKLDETGRWVDIVKDITNKHYKDLSRKQKAILDKVELSVWDVIMSQSGGHKAITNLTNLNFLGRGYVDVMKGIMVDIVKELQKHV